MNPTRSFSNVRVIGDGNTVYGRCNYCGIREAVEDHKCPTEEQRPSTNPLPDHIGIEIKGDYTVFTPRSLMALFALDDEFPDALWMSNIVAVPRSKTAIGVAAVYNYIKEVS